MNYFLKILPLVLILILAGCGHSSKDHALLEEAAKIHQEAVKIDETVKPQLDALVNQANSLAVQGRALTEEEQAFINAVGQLQTSYGFWEENHIEVPGFDHEHGHHHHDHDHDHSHDHGPGLELTASDMLLVQKEFRDSIISIKERVEALGQ